MDKTTIAEQHYVARLRHLLATEHDSIKLLERIAEAVSYQRRLLMVLSGCWRMFG